MKEFLFSPYLDINIPTTAISQPTKSANVAPQLLVESPAGAIPQDMKALTLAFATGECGNERWGGRHSKEIVGSTIKSLRRAGIAYVISTGGAQGVFNCSTDEGMAQFIAHYDSSYLMGFDFDIEANQPEAAVTALVEQIGAAMRRKPYLRFSFTLAAQSGAGTTRGSLNRQGDLVMQAIARAGLKNYFVNLMVMNFGEAKSNNCVVESEHCDMAASAIQVIRNFSRQYSVPLRRIEVTPMIGVNDVTANVFTLSDARALASFVSTNGLGGLHFWSLNRDQPCAQSLSAVSPTCSSLDGLRSLEFTNTFAIDSH